MEKSILITLKYFDLFDYPLKGEEIWKWLMVKDKVQVARELFDETLASLVSKNLIKKKSDYFFLVGRDSLIQSRKLREEYSLKKISKARRIGRLFSFIPGLKMISVVSNLGYLNAPEDADIDLFIVTSNNRIWTVRFWTVILMKLLNNRPSKKKMKDKICLSYFVVDSQLNLEQTKISQNDIHLVYLVATNLFIYDRDNYIEKFVEENKWLNNYLSNFKYSQNEKKFVIKNSGQWLIGVMEKLSCDWLEKIFKKIQYRFMAGELRVAMNRGDKKVIINDKMLKLHSNDKREEINKNFI